VATPSSILSLHCKQRSLLFARMAGIAYQELAHATKSAKKLGFTSVKIYDNGGAQAYKFMNKHDVVIACRGTEPSEFNAVQKLCDSGMSMEEAVTKVAKERYGSA